MADLSFMKTTLTVADACMEARPVKPRKYLGFSEIGKPCARYLWLKFHTGISEKPKAKMIRLFGLGNYIERRIIRDFKRADFEISGKQKAFRDFKGKFKGHCDGIITGLVESKKPHIFEAKSASKKHFALFQKHGITGHPEYGAQYYAQKQMYMHYSGLKDAYCVVESKDNSEQFKERTKYNRKDALALIEKAEKIIYSKIPLKAINSRPNWYQCKWCIFNNAQYCRKVWKGESPF